MRGPRLLHRVAVELPSPRLIPELSRRQLSSSRTLLRHGKPADDDVVELAFSRHDPPEKTSMKGPGPIIIMHGLFGSQRNNRTMSKALAKDLSRPVYNVDLRNHGASPHSPTHTYQAMARDVEHFLARHQVRTPTLIGHSMGAKVAMTLALRQPTHYSALVPVDNAPVDAALAGDFAKYVQAMREIEEHRPPLKSQKDADRVLAKYEPDLAIRQFLLTNLVKANDTHTAAHEHHRPHGTSSPPGSQEPQPQPQLRFRIPVATLAKNLANMADFPFKDPHANQYKGPTLVVRGTKSHYVADETLPVIGAFFPRFELLDVDCGHWVMSERFDEFRSGVAEFMTRVVDEQ
ncbi:Abhydrolase domain-containing protein IMO32 [Cladophialophora carrionii]|uniref:Abhydrolase domain-containing protein IMO32 n=1 Tax=Cladophialophora carrionii TaxID=86049 RepID=A0A1C1D1N4_9EURO|nr:Abhydrolase domain-containing protein IMO32 [Cladophialophora carrionii]